MPRGCLSPNSLTAASDTTLVALDHHARVPAEHKPEPATDTVTAPAASKRFGWRNVALALLALVVLVQGGLMAFWMITGALAVTAPNTGSVTVTSEPSGSPVTIDGAARGVNAVDDWHCSRAVIGLMSAQGPNFAVRT